MSAALRTALSCLVIALLVSGPVALCKGREHVVGVLDPSPYAAAERQPAAFELAELLVERQHEADRHAG